MFVSQVDAWVCESLILQHYKGNPGISGSLWFCPSWDGMGVKLNLQSHKGVPDQCVNKNYGDIRRLIEGRKCESQQ